MSGDAFAEFERAGWERADGEEFALPIAARLISARTSGPAGHGQADRERQ